ncbi:3-keto-5-aminohexanoate cleavage enzyme [Croceifilum oryzae]|uniref:3-keto-5-aminohexanoate cleavage enzyme n=1 Tax=Croceifilum oryzae TaxID=1553429 RepID=A0AAJ1TH33_9BACL|nr:3-keto-5-aminohexanoate cleavage protein [Croceifilum oryzae]MDQ0418364.1 3-keto-5-aminohexanoate cleavage enzyme [Croceifilum oryzae]
MQKLIITVALVGAEVRKEDTPHLPIMPDEMAEQAQEVYEAGASIVHIHARDLEGNSTQDREIYREIIAKIRERCPIIIQVSTGGAVGMTDDERIQPISLKPEMATLTTGTVNFGEEVFMNSATQIRRFALEMKENGVRPEFEIFDTGMIENAYKLVRDGYVRGHLHYDFVMGVPGAMPATPEQLLFVRKQIPEGATWTVAGIGRAQLPMSTMAILLGGHVRVGLEDNIYYRKGELATNRQLVERVVRISREIGREIATPDEARKILQIS